PDASDSFLASASVFAETVAEGAAAKCTSPDWSNRILACGFAVMCFTGGRAFSSCSALEAGCSELAGALSAATWTVGEPGRVSCFCTECLVSTPRLEKITLPMIISEAARVAQRTDHLGCFRANEYVGCTSTGGVTINRTSRHWAHAARCKRALWRSAPVRQPSAKAVSVSGSGCDSGDRPFSRAETSFPTASIYALSTPFTRFHLFVGERPRDRILR